MPADFYQAANLGVEVMWNIGATEGEHGKGGQRGRSGPSSLVGNVGGDLERRPTVIGDLLGERFPEHDSKRVNVRLLCVALTTKDLGGRVLEGVRGMERGRRGREYLNGAETRHGFARLDATQAEVAELAAPILIDEEVLRLEVAVNDRRLEGVQVDHAPRRIEHELELLFDGWLGD